MKTIRFSLSEFLDSEVEHWRQREEEEKENIVVINGGTCEVFMMIDFADEIDREWLLARYKKIKVRKTETKMYKLAKATMERDKMRLDAIKRVGNWLKENAELPVDNNKEADIVTA